MSVSAPPKWSLHQFKKSPYPPQVCELCRKLIEEENMLDHYRKYHPQDLKKRQKIGIRLAREAPHYGRRTRAREVKRLASAASS